MLIQHALRAAALLALTASTAFATTVTAQPGPPDTSIWSYVSPTKQARQTHILSVYSGGLMPQGNNQINVHVNGKTSHPVTLVVSSYESTKWVFDGNGRANIGTVIINGVKDSTVKGLPFYTKIVRRTGENAKTGARYYYSPCAVEWPNDNRGCDTPSLVKGVEAYTGWPISSFTANDYNITDFTVNLSN